MAGTMRRRTGAVLVSVLFAGLLTVVGAGPANACGNMETYRFRTMHVSMKAAKPHYRIGQTVKINLKVKRFNDTDPLEQGVPMDDVPYEEPVEGVGVGVGFQIGYSFRFGYGITDENGETTVKIKLDRGVEKGTALASSLAEERHLETVCATIMEYGQAVSDKLFHVH